jgi:hypothetical protein
MVEAAFGTGLRAILEAPALVLPSAQSAALGPYVTPQTKGLKFTIFYYFLRTLHTPSGDFRYRLTRESYAESWAGVTDEEALALE